MKPWELHRETVAEAEPLQIEECLAGFRAVFEERPAYWRAYGERSPNVFQFEIGSNEDLERWFIQLDGNGVEVQLGQHRAPTIYWRSSARAFDAAFSGTHHDDDPVRIEGSLQKLQDLLRAVAQS